MLLSSAQHGFTADATNELKTLVKKIKADLKTGKKTEADMADDLKQFDILMAKHKGEKTDAVAQILYTKAELYDEVFHDKAKADELVAQLKTDFKDTEFVANLEKQEAAAAAAKKIKDALAVGTTFPDFNEKDVTGQPISIADHKGKVVMIDFWATWCPPCRAELPNIIATYNKHHAQGFDIIGISLDENQAKLTKYIKHKDMIWQQFFDKKKEDNKLAVKYGIQLIPSDFLLDGNGKIIGKDLFGKELDDAVAKAVSKN